MTKSVYRCSPLCRQAGAQQTVMQKNVPLHVDRTCRIRSAGKENEHSSRRRCNSVVGTLPHQFPGIYNLEEEYRDTKSF